MMKRAGLIGGVAVALAMGVGCAAPAAEPEAKGSRGSAMERPEDDAKNLTPLYRVWTGTGHFYTTSESEARGAGTLEGTVGCVFSSLDAGAKLGARQFYRFYSASENLHFYSRSKEEGMNAPGYTYEGDAGYVFGSEHPDTVPLYRSVSPTTNDHLYALDANEGPSAGYQDEGVAAYVYGPDKCNGATAANEQAQAPDVGDAPVAPAANDPAPPAQEKPAVEKCCVRCANWSRTYHVSTDGGLCRDAGIAACRLNDRGGYVYQTTTQECPEIPESNNDGLVIVQE